MTLVPQDQPHGARKELVEDRQAAGIPLTVPSSPSGGSLTASPPPVRPQPPLDMLRAASPSQQPDLGAILNPAPVNTQMRLRELRDASQNLVARELLSRLIGE